TSRRSRRLRGGRGIRIPRRGSCALRVIVGIVEWFCQEWRRAPHRTLFQDRYTGLGNGEMQVRPLQKAKISGTVTDVMKARPYVHIDMKRFLAAILLLVPCAGVRAATFIVADDRTLVQASRAIVVATAGESHSRWAPGGWIETVTSMHVDEAIKGDVGATIEVVELGGVVGDAGYMVAGSPRYAAGERVLLFLEKNDRGDFVTKNMTVGKFAFGRDARGRRLLVRDSGEVVGWDLDGAPHRERTRDADGFLTFVRATARGEE